jgi:cytochrome c-type biogenesis protein CcmH/NrfG
LDNMLRLDPKDQGTYYSMGVYYYKFEHSRSKAYQAFKKALDLDPRSSVGKAAFYAIEFMRNNPDSRVAPDFSFINQEYRE